MNMIEVNDFITLTTTVNIFEKNSVGLVKSKLSNTKFSVFFIGKQITYEVDITNIKYLDVKKTGKPHKFKICNVCHILKKDIEEFDINQTDAKGRKTTRPSCKSCRIKVDGVSLKSEEKERLDKVKPKYFFICPICEKGSIPGITANLVKDHNHLTGNAREWLCDSCNTGLGRFKDDIKLMRKAIKYLNKHSK